MSTFTAVDLSRLPAPAVVEQLDYEVILAEMLADLRARDPQFTALTESDPTYKLLEVGAYRELQARQRNNESAKAVMLAYSRAADLDHLGAYFGVERLELDTGNPAQSIPPTMESDTEFRRRIQLAPEGFSVAGPEGAYIFHALSAASGVLDASATSPTPDDIRAIVMGVLTAHAAAPALVADMEAALDGADWPGDVVVTVLSRDGDGTPNAELVSAVAQRLGSDEVRPMTDHVMVQGATVVPYAVNATVYTYAGPDSSLVLAESQRRLERYVDESHRLGRDVPLSGIYSVLHSEGVQRVELTSPAADVVINRTQAAWCTGITIVAGGVDE